MSWTQPVLDISQALRTSLEKVSVCSYKEEKVHHERVAPPTVVEALLLTSNLYM